MSTINICGQDLINAKLRISVLYTRMEMENKKRPSWHEYFFTIAEEISKRSTCTHAHMGAAALLDVHIALTSRDEALGVKKKVAKMKSCCGEKKCKKGN